MWCIGVFAGVSVCVRASLCACVRACARGKHGRAIVFGKRNILRLHLNESREGFCRRGRGTPFHVDGPKTEKAREPALN